MCRDMSGFRVAKYLTVQKASIGVNGHTDTMGTDELNLDLSECWPRCVHPRGFHPEVGFIGV